MLRFSKIQYCWFYPPKKITALYFKEKHFPNVGIHLARLQAHTQWHLDCADFAFSLATSFRVCTPQNISTVPCISLICNSQFLICFASPFKRVHEVSPAQLLKDFLAEILGRNFPSHSLQSKGSCSFTALTSKRRQGKKRSAVVPAGSRCQAMKLQRFALQARRCEIQAA